MSVLTEKILFFFLCIYFPFLSFTRKMPQYIGAIDQGTTSTRFLIFDQAGNHVTSHQLEFEQIYPRPG